MSELSITVNDVEPVEVLVQPVEDGGTPIEAPITPVKLVSGDSNAYEIAYGNGVVEKGGIAMVSTDQVKANVIEGTHVVTLPFSKILDYQATALNVADTPENITGESVFVAQLDNGIKLYATASARTTKTIPVKWMAKGVM